jgi:FOG: WD40 repeat
MNSTITKGQRIGSYNIVDPLGQTRFGHIYLGQQVQQHVQVIIEVFQPLLTKDLEESFLTQVHTLMKLEHPHILPLRDTGVQNHIPFLVVDAAPYRTLRQLYPQGSRQSLAALLPYLKQIASALHYAHAHGVLHGDLRLENILLDSDNNILLVGFLIAAIVQNQERTGQQQTALLPLAPEQTQGKASPASDQYALAVLVYELLSGSLPFSESSTRQPLPVSLLKLNVPDLSPGVDRVVMKALDENPARRFADVVAFVHALEEECEASRIAEDATVLVSTKEINAQSVQDEASEITEDATLLLPTKEINTRRVQDEASRTAADATVHLSAKQVNAQKEQQDEIVPRRPQPLSVRSQRAQRGDTPMLSRRSFAIGLISLAALSGAGGWYLLSRRLAASATPVSTGAGTAPSAQRKTVQNKNVLVFTGHLASVNAVAWSPDGQLIASASDDTYVQIFRASSGERTVLYSGHKEEVVTVGWSPDGRFIASGGQDATVQVWQAANGNRQLTYRGHTDRVNSLSWSNDSQLVASGSDDKSVQVWQASNGNLAFDFLGHTAGVLCVGWQPNNSSVASGSWDGTLRDWATMQHGSHFATGSQIFDYGGHGKNEVNALSWSPNGSLIASAGADRTVQISSGVDGTPQLPFFSSPSQASANPILSVAWSPDGSAIASGDTAGNVYVWRVSDRKTFFRLSGTQGSGERRGLVA